MKETLKREMGEKGWEQKRCQNSSVFEIIAKHSNFIAGGMEAHFYANSAVMNGTELTLTKMGLRIAES